jgi:hypothetical protein
VTTLRLPHADELDPKVRQELERVAKRAGSSPDRMPTLWRAQAHWPEHLETNIKQMALSLRIRGKIPNLTKEAMYTAVAMTNHCAY